MRSRTEFGNEGTGQTIMTDLTRRDFAKAGAAGVLTALSAGRVLGANSRIRLGFIGLGNRGDQVLDAFLPHKDAEIVALCDLYQPYLDFAAKKAGGSAEDDERLPRNPLHEGRGRRRDLHAGPLARTANHPRLPGR